MGNQTGQAEENELSLRLARVMAAVTAVHGSLENAHRWLHTDNFSLGGERPIALIQTAGGERAIMAELQAQAEGAPI